MSLKTVIQNFLKKRGYVFIKYPYGNERKRMNFIFSNNISLILDVGANSGQYGSMIREFKYKGKVISFEPLSDAFNNLSDVSKNDTYWEAVNIALGNFNGESSINIAGNSYSSSILEMLPSHLNAAPESSYIGTEKITVKKLDSIFNKYCKTEDNIFLKMDTQGSEKNILEGAEKSLEFIKIIQLEMSLVELYKGEILYYDMINFLKSKGFHLFLIENEFNDLKTNELLQINGLFLKLKN